MSDRETPRGPAAERLDRLAARAGLAISWEQVWPVAAMLLTILGLFLAISFLGLWLERSHGRDLAAGGGAVAGAGHTLDLGLQALLETVVHTAEKQAGA